MKPKTQKKKVPFYKRSILSVLAVLMIGVFIPLAPTQATGLPVVDTLLIGVLGADIATKKVEKTVEKTVAQIAAVAFKNGVTQFLSRIAQDTASWIASGDKGQKPLIFTNDWETYLQKEGESAIAGAVIEFADEVGLGDICATPKLAIDIAIPELEPAGVRKPRCSLDELRDTWNVKDPAFLKNFSLSFEPGANDLSVAINSINLFELERDKRAKNAEKSRKEGDTDVKSIKSTVSQVVQTPSFLVKRIYEDAGADSKSAAFIYTGEPIADAVNVFTTTLFSQYMQRLQSGFFTLADLVDEEEDQSSLFFEEAFSTLNQRNAEIEFTNVFKPPLKQVTNFDILSEFQVCPTEVQFASLFNCTMDSGFAEAVRGFGDNGYMTVREAVEANLLHGEWSFGFTDPGGGIEPSFINGYAYSNMKKLRRARIIPIGWELAALKARNSGRAVTLQDVINDFENTGSPFYHLVDPNWVLKSPQLTCKAQLPGQILLQGTGNRVDTCVDYQDCVVEGNNDTCLAFGNCTHEKSVWDFPGDKCEEAFATCDLYIDRLEQSSQDNRWLSSTLDPGECNANNAGCTWYAINKDANGDFVEDAKIYLTSEAESCNSDAAGCKEYIDISAGANLLRNPSFEDDGGNNYVLGTGDQTFENGIPDGWSAIAADVNLVGDAANGNVAAEINPNGSGSSCLPGLQYQAPLGTFEVGQTYTLSGVVKTDDSAERNLVITFQGIQFTIEAVGDRYVPFAFNFVMPATADFSTLILGANANDCAALNVGTKVFYDAIQLEKGIEPTEFKNYEENPKVFLADAPACTFEDVGCQTYLPKDSQNSVPVTGVITGQDLCPSECVGYDTYEQQETDLELAKFENFIPTSAQQCSAEVVGCQEFTNLDAVQAGGEGREFYSQIRHCEKPQPQCATYFAWEGDDVSGFQLMSFSLLAESLDGTGAPLTTDASTTCDPDDVNCREFIGEDGSRYPRDLFKTITCSNQCVPLRATEGLVTQSECEAKLGTFDAASNRCIYNAIPQESRSCPAQFVGCREYVGNTGTNVAVVFAEDFEDGDTIGWTNGIASTEALTVGGKSMKLGDEVGSVNEEVSTFIDVIPGSGYVVEFFAKSSVSDFVDINVFLGDEEIPATRLGGVISNTSNWTSYKVGPLQLSDNEDSTLALTFEIAGTSSKPDEMSVFLDNVLVRAVEGSVFVVKDSWDTPITCDTNPPLDGGQASRTMVGCQAYTTQGGIVGNDVFAKSFTRLCSEDKIGCQAYVDTHNSDAPYREVFNQGDPAELTVPEDQVVFLVGRGEFQCSQQSAGCMELGEPEFDLSDNVTGFKSVFKLNDPDSYDVSLCQDNELFCRAFTVSDGSQVFAKHPGLKQCEYREVPNSFPPRSAWFIRGENEENPDECLLSLQNEYVRRCPVSQISCTQFFEPITQESYFIKKNTIRTDAASQCNGEVNWKRGCVLFDDISDRSKTLKSGEDEDFIGIPEGCQTNDVGCNTNVLLKVDLNRQCTQWITGLSTSRLWNRRTEQYQLTNYTLGRCLEHDPANPTICRKFDNNPQKPLVDSESYQSRETNFNSEDLTGYSIPNLYPVETLRQKALAFDEDGNATNFRLTRLVNPGSLCTDFNDCPDDQVCRLEFNVGSADFIGRCYDEQGIDGTSRSLNQECRGYPELNSPFPSRLARFAPENDSENPGAVVEKDPIYRNANVGQKGENVECTYHKAYYGLGGGITRYYGIDSIPDSQVTLEGQTSNFTKKETYYGWPGYCLERDPSRLINGSDSETACITWYPVDVVEGAIDLNNTALNASYVVGDDSQYYCAHAVFGQYLRFKSNVCGVCDSPFYDSFREKSRCRKPTLGFDPSRVEGVAIAGGIAAILIVPIIPVIAITAAFQAVFQTGLFGDDGVRETTCIPRFGEGWYPMIYPLFNSQNPDHGIMCMHLARIQGNTGRNQAFTTRIREEFGYTISDLDFTFNQHNAPFGAARFNELKPEELNQPLVYKSPTAFVNDCAFCQRQGGFTFATCQDSDENKFGKPCPLVPNTGSPYAFSNPYFEFTNNANIPIRAGNLPPSQGSHPYTVGEIETVDDGFRRLQELFARSYGVWRWNVGEPSVCVGQCKTGINAGSSCISNSACGDQDLDVTYTCSAPGGSSGLCVGGNKATQSCSADADCAYDPSFAPHTCIANPDFDASLPNNDVDPDICDGGVDKGLACDTDSDCNPELADGICDFNVKRCVASQNGSFTISTLSGRECTTSDECNERGLCEVQACSTGEAADNLACLDGAEPGDLCGEQAVRNSYIRLNADDEFNGWDIIQDDPTLAEIPFVRPVVVDPRSINGVREGLREGVTFNGQSEGDLEAQDGRAPASVSFYAYNNNGEQMPIRVVLIDWGDGTDPAQSRGSFKNHKHQCNRFCSNLFSGERKRCTEDIQCETIQEPDAECLPANFGDTIDACIEDGDGIDGFFSFAHTYTCDGPEVCEFTPQVVVQDNFGATTRVVYPGKLIVNPAIPDVDPLTPPPPPAGPNTDPSLTLSFVSCKSIGTGALKQCELQATISDSDDDNWIVTATRTDTLQEVFNDTNTTRVRSIFLQLDPGNYILSVSVDDQAGGSTTEAITFDVP